jgi:hypothetical protein
MPFNFDELTRFAQSLVQVETLSCHEKTGHRPGWRRNAPARV